jgi:hypothetical protein
MTIDFDLLDYITQLRHAGLRPSEKLTQRILGLGEAAVTPLVELAADGKALLAEAPLCFAPIHALRLLGELGAVRIARPLLQAFPMDDGTTPEGSPSEIWDTELPQILGRLGEAATADLWAFADDTANSVAGRAAALSALAYATAVAPELREQVVAGLRERLAAADDPILAGHALIALGNIGAPEAYAEIMALFKAGKIDRELIGPGTARQLLLSTGEKRLGCARHPLWERYDQHGPFPPHTHQH